MSGDHTRNTQAMMASPRCGAGTRRGFACSAPAIRGKVRCRMHGGARGSGAPRGNRNAYRHGMCTPDGHAERQQMKALLEDAWKLLSEVN